FLHGLPLNSFQWRGAIDLLASERRCIAADFMGLGYTRVAEGQGVTPSDQTDMLAALLDRLKIPSVDLIANDSGDAVAQLFVARYPQRVRTLLLTNGDEERNCPPEVVKGTIEEARVGKATVQFEKWLQDLESNRSPQGIGGQAYADPAGFSDEAVEYYFKPLVASARAKALFDAFMLGLLPNPLEGIGPALKRFQGPVRIVWGSADTIFLAENPERLDRAFGRSLGIRRLPGYKLFWPEERPDLIAEEARALWAAAKQPA
ncbi:MAG: alpha/beta fold hydrolase, partial [Lysobacter sp.]